MVLEMKYFILKPRSKTRIDPYAEASRWALREFARRIKDYDPELASQLEQWAYDEMMNSGRLGGEKNE